MTSDWKWLEEIHDYYRDEIRGDSSDRQEVKDIARLISVVKNMREALIPFAKMAEWTSADLNDTRACILCDTGGAGEPTINGHDYDCPIECARETLARCKDGKLE